MSLHIEARGRRRVLKDRRPSNVTAEEWEAYKAPTELERDREPGWSPPASPPREARRYECECGRSVAGDEIRTRLYAGQVSVICCVHCVAPAAPEAIGS
jgi:hypothetical protein